RFHWHLRWCYDSLSLTTSTVVVGEIAGDSDLANQSFLSSDAVTLPLLLILH
ncbi:hypothetical protein A2U01_0031144, partial [Trifolium medium]|nr:hypothetical protein [Trifolium medium]